ncbi:MAG: prepilin-type N-terminal cleavage/methylation domain-containing protein [Planctomycetes bacterium]|nr:prepilin-type N-terminal cleavage/methylation domain-containing protein [Planctomycetota bacterium]
MIITSSTLHSRQLAPAPTTAGRGGFTLVELLIVIMIISILASITTFALWDSMEAARAARTRAQIQKIHEFLMIKWESYRTRPVPVNTGRLPRELAPKARLNALRQLMRMELPDRITDVTDDPAPILEIPSGTSVINVDMPEPALWLAYRRRATSTWSEANQQAECLYLILASMQDGTRSALEFFRDNEVADTDGDGMLEIVDGWGRPIRFLRWAPGYQSPLHRIDQFQLPAAQRTELQPDSFDVLKVDPRWKNNNHTDRHYPDDRPTDYPVGALPASPVDVTLDDPFQLFPVVFSAGSDGLYHVLLDLYDPTVVPAAGDPLPNDDYDPSTGAYNGVAVANQLHYRNTNAASFTYSSGWPFPEYPPPAWPTQANPPPPGSPQLWPEISSRAAPRNDPYLLLPGSEMPASGGVGVRIGVQYGAGAEDNIDNHWLVVE